MECKLYLQEVLWSTVSRYSSSSDPDYSQHVDCFNGSMVDACLLVAGSRSRAVCQMQAGKKFMQEIFAVDPDDSESGLSSSNGSNGTGSVAPRPAARIPRRVPLRNDQRMPWETSSSSSSSSLSASGSVSE